MLNVILRGLSKAALAPVVIALVVCSRGVQADPIPEDPVELPTVNVTASGGGLASAILAGASSGSEGVITGRRLNAMPILRPGDVLESIPGLIVTQHSGDGKANQYFLRGFNLDHGTDFATTLGGVPINMPSHAHGQGYTDLNFLSRTHTGDVDHQNIGRRILQLVNVPRRNRTQRQQHPADTDHRCNNSQR